MTDNARGPVPNSTLPFWRTQLHPLDSHRSTPELPKEADFVIIGAGFSGASLAYYLTKEESLTPTSVVILEAREACSGASGRNGGNLKPDVYFQLAKLLKRFGVEKAVEVSRFEVSQVLALKKLIEEEDIDCDLTITRGCDVILDPEFNRETEEAYEALLKTDQADLSDVYHAKTKDAERISGVKGALSCFTFTAGHIWPYKMIMHLLQLAVSKGCNLQTHTPVTQVSDVPLPDGRWEVKTGRGTIAARKVLFASNAFTRNVAPQFEKHIIPVRGICSRIVVPDGQRGPLLSYSYNIRHGPGLYDYLIPRADGSIIVGGAKPPFWHDRSLWYNVTDDSKLIEPAKDYFDGFMQRTFAGWEDSGAYTDRVWTGIMGWSSDFMPYVGEIPGKEGQIILGGFSGHGMPLILLSARCLVDMMRQGKSYEETGLPSLFKPTPERLASTRNDILGTDGETVAVVRSKL